MDGSEREAVEQRLEILDLLIRASERRAEVLEVVSNSRDEEEAEERIRELFGVRTPLISRAVLDQQISRWTRSAREQLAAAADELRRSLG